MVARLGGDEFVVLLEGLSEDFDEATTLAGMAGNAILQSLNHPYQLGQHHYQSSSSIGITLFQGNERTLSELFKQADISMYEAKKSGRNALRFFDPQMQEAFNARTLLEIQLRKAVELQQFQLYYQVQVNEAGDAIGAEALIRWIHPEIGLISPLNFIPLAEETGLIIPIGKWVLETACSQLNKWGKNKSTKNLILSVNISSIQFSQKDFVNCVLGLVNKYEIEPNHLKLELTESVLSDSLSDVVSFMTKLEASGVLFTLDDFGTGYSSLQYLKSLPLNELKIDQSFIRDLAFDKNDRSIVRTIIAMANSLGLSVIAEGVETDEQKTLLINKGCKHFQGYLYGKPMPLETFENSLK